MPVPLTMRGANLPGWRTCSKVRAIVLGLLIAQSVSAQWVPMPRTNVHDWTIQTPMGKFGYEEWRGGWMPAPDRRFPIGRIGRGHLYPREVAAGLFLVGLIVVVVTMGFGRRRRKAGKKSNDA